MNSYKLLKEMETKGGLLTISKSRMDLQILIQYFLILKISTACSLPISI